MYATDVRETDVRRQTDVTQKHRLMPPPYEGGGIITGGCVAHNQWRRQNFVSGGTGLASQKDRKE